MIVVLGASGDLAKKKTVRKLTSLTRFVPVSQMLIVHSIPPYSVL